MIIPSSIISVLGASSPHSAQLGDKLDWVDDVASSDVLSRVVGKT